MTQPRNVDFTGAALALLISAFWGANSVAIKLALSDIPPLRLAGVRFLIGAAIILVWAGCTGRLGTLAVKRGDWQPLIVLGLLFAAQIGSMNIGTSLTSAAHSAVILNSYVVHTVVLGHFLIPGDRLTLPRLAGVLTGYAGVIILFARQTDPGAATLTGDVIMCVSAFLLAERTVYLARAVHRFEPVQLLIAQAAIGTAIFLVVSALVEPEPTHWTLPLVAAIGYQGIVVSGFNFIVNLWLLKRYRPSALAGLFLTQPVFGVLTAVLLTDDRLTPELLLSSVAVALGIGLTSGASRIERGRRV